MIISEQWLRELVSTKLDAQQIADALTLAGLEVDAVEELQGQIDHVVIGEVLKVTKHPDADRLNLTEVYIGGETLNIVCGAANVVEGLRVPVAKIGAELPNGLTIKAAKVRGQESFGMLCSASELGLEESSDGLLELPKKAPIGANVSEYLQLQDVLIDIDLTPNRGDCLSVQGIARELRVLIDAEYTPVKIIEKAVSSRQTIAVQVNEPELCPSYMARVIEGVDASAPTPIWMQQRLLRCGVRPISAIVDITNYVMLELGQPMHAFDLGKLHKKGIIVRKAEAGESVELLDDSTAELDDETLVIADNDGPIAIAGVMGGLHSAISPQTNNVVLEAAHFTRSCVAGKARRYGLHTDSSHRFERGVDPQLPAKAIERATELVLKLCGGTVGAVNNQTSKANLKKNPKVNVRFARLNRVLGMPLKKKDVDAILKRISKEVIASELGWQVIAPSYRFDVERECDLIEEVARVRGYDSLEDRMPKLVPSGQLPSESRVSLRRLQQTLVTLGYHESISYSFVEPGLLNAFSSLADDAGAEQQVIELANPLAENMAVMRTSLWPGLINACQFNVNRQHDRIRLFETGTVFHKSSTGEITEKAMLAGLATGSVYPEQWNSHSGDKVDFYDIKSDLKALFTLTGKESDFIFNSLEHKALHPGQVSGIYRNDDLVGYLGKIHPQLAQSLDLPDNLFLFELELDKTLSGCVPGYQSVSKYPAVTRDLALITRKQIIVNDLLMTIRNMGIDVLNTVNLFDVYSGLGVNDECKSVAIKLTFQHQERTLTDDEIEQSVGKVLHVLKQNFGAELRS